VPNVQIRHVSPATHRRLVTLADRKGMSLSEFLRLELERIAALPTWEEIGKRLEPYRVDLEPGLAARLVREDRDAH
jgi:hypothetical protein